MSSRVIASFPKPDISLLPPAVYAVFIADAAPVKVATVAAFTTPVVLPLRVFSVATARVVSDRVTASFPRPLIPDEA